MTIERMHPNGMFSKIVIHSGIVYSAGIVSEQWSGDIRFQTLSILDQIDSLLADAGTNKARLLSTSCWLKDMADFPVFNEVFKAWVDPDNQPTRATVQADLADPALLVEIAFQAVR